MATTKYCIGCIYLDLTPRDPGSMGSTYTGIYGDEEAAAFCKRGHWKAEMGPNATLENFRLCMEKATDCPDFEERETPMMTKPRSDLTKRQKKAAATLLAKRPMCLPGTNAILRASEAEAWHDLVTKAVLELKLNPQQIAAFCDAAGVAS